MEKIRHPGCATLDVGDSQAGDSLKEAVSHQGDGEVLNESVFLQQLDKWLEEIERVGVTIVIVT